MKFAFEKIEIPSSVPVVKWEDWHWQMQNSMKSAKDFSQVFSLTEEEKMAFDQGQEIFNIRLTPYYAALCGQDQQDPLRKIAFPHHQEFLTGTQAQLDPLNERKNNPAPRIIHRYPDRVLFLVTDFCSVYCRYCTRKHFTGQDLAFPKEQDYQDALQYIRTHPGVREIILSGGDPLTLSDNQLKRVLSDLRQIEHVEIIRIGSRMPVVCPMRITPGLVQILKSFQPIYLMTHFNHPRELTATARGALDLLADHGVPMMNQMVLLNGVNNHPAIVQALSRRLLFLRVKPYYMFQCDPSHGTDHLRTSLEESEEIQRELWGNLSGLAMPNLSVDVPSGGGKIGLTPQFEVERSLQGRSYVGWDGVREQYLNPTPGHRLQPLDVDQYQGEWEQLKSAKTEMKNPEFKNPESNGIKPGSEITNARAEHTSSQIS